MRTNCRALPANFTTGPVEGEHREGEGRDRTKACWGTSYINFLICRIVYYNKYTGTVVLKPQSRPEARSMGLSDRVSLHVTPSFVCSESQYFLTGASSPYRFHPAIGPIDILQPPFSACALSYTARGCCTESTCPGDVGNFTIRVIRAVPPITASRFPLLGRNFPVPRQRCRKSYDSSLHHPPLTPQHDPLGDTRQG